ncbi:MAG: sigma-70 family RNA polymerase sigma factor [Thermoleophilia bacterium]
MADPATLTDAFEAHRAHLRSVAYRMLGSLSEADDAVQETWIRMSRAGTAGVENLGGWLTTVTARVCLTTLRARRAHPQEALDGHGPEPIVDPAGGTDPEHEALLADSVGFALLVVLDTLSPAERLSFVLHDMFAVPFEEIAEMTGRSPAAARQLASRARRRVRSGAPAPEPDLSRQQEVVGAFMAASREGDLDRLVAVLDPGVLLRTQTPDGRHEVRGAAEVAGQAAFWSRTLGRDLERRPVLVNGAAGILALRDGTPVSLMGCTVVGDRILAIDILADPVRLAAMGLGDR